MYKLLNWNADVNSTKVTPVRLDLARSM